MAIATINGESWARSCSPDEAQLARPGASDVDPAAAAVISSGQLQSGPRDALALGSAPDVPFYKPMPTAAPLAVRAEAFAPALRGYAPSGAQRESTAAVSSAASAKVEDSGSKSSAVNAASTKTSTKSTSTKSTSTKSGELAFLDDKRLSIEDKLFQFMTLMTKKNDQELVDAMKDYETRKETQSKSSSSSPNAPRPQPKLAQSTGQESSDGGGGLFGMLGDALGSIGKAVVGGAESLAKDLGGPVLAGVVTAAGMPFLAPVALQVGGNLSAGLIEGVASTVGLGKSSATGTRTSASASSGSAGSSGSSSSGTKKASSSSATKATASSTDEFDEKLAMFQLQRLVEKQNAMFSALTNAMKSMHESQMTAVQNIR